MTAYLHRMITCPSCGRKVPWRETVKDDGTCRPCGTPGPYYLKDATRVLVTDRSDRARAVEFFEFSYRERVAFASEGV